MRQFRSLKLPAEGQKIPGILGELQVFGVYWEAKNVGSVSSEGWQGQQHLGKEVLTSKMCRQAGNTAS